MKGSRKDQKLILRSRNIALNSAIQCHSNHELGVNVTAGTGKVAQVLPNEKNRLRVKGFYHEKSVFFYDEPC